MDTILNNTNYFYRNAIITKQNNKVALIDIDQVQNITALDDWLGIVVSLADGHHTIKELVEYMSHQYNKAPDNLELTIHSALNRLIDGNIVRLSAEKVELPYYLSAPIEDLDIEKARKLIKEDGYHFSENDQS